MKFKNPEEAVSEYLKSALLHDNANRSGDFKTGNRAERVIRSVLKYLWHKNPYVLSPLLRHENDNVRCWTAMFWLEINEEQAISIFKEIQTSNSFYATDAKYAIREWNNGKLGSEQWEN